MNESTQSLARSASNDENNETDSDSEIEPYYIPEEEGELLRAEAGRRNLPTTEKRRSVPNSRYFNRDYESYHSRRN